MDDFYIKLGSRSRARSEPRFEPTLRSRPRSEPRLDDESSSYEDKRDRDRYRKKPISRSISSEDDSSSSNKYKPDKNVRSSSRLKTTYEGDRNLRTTILKPTYKDEDRHDSNKPIIKPVPPIRLPQTQTKVPQVITAWKSRFIKAYMLITGIIIVTTGLFMIDESCGCIRKEDKLLSLALKLYVFLGIIILVLGLFFNTENKKLYIGYCTAFVLISGTTLALNSWIIKKAKEMFDSMIAGENTKCRVKKDDSRFLSYSIVGLTVLSVSVFTSIMLLLWVYL
jgi:hypothetical protein